MKNMLICLLAVLFIVSFFNIGEVFSQQASNNQNVTVSKGEEASAPSDRGDKGDKTKKEEILVKENNKEVVTKRITSTKGQKISSSEVGSKLVLSGPVFSTDVEY